MGKFSAEQKERIVKKLEYNCQERLKKLRTLQESLIANLGSKIAQHRNQIPKKFRDIKIKDVINMEREGKVTFANLLQLTRTSTNEAMMSIPMLSPGKVKNNSPERIVRPPSPTRNLMGKTVKGSLSPKKSVIKKTTLSPKKIIRVNSLKRSTGSNKNPISSPTRIRSPSRNMKNFNSAKPTAKSMATAEAISKRIQFEHNELVTKTKLGRISKLSSPSKQSRN